MHSFIGEDKYYIKRLIGEPGDTLEMRVRIQSLRTEPMFEKVLEFFSEMAIV